MTESVTVSSSLPSKSGLVSRQRHWLLSLVNSFNVLLWGVLFCMFLPLSMISAGWAYRLARNVAFRRWSRLAANELGTPPLPTGSLLPNWLMSDRADRQKGRLYRVTGGMLASLKLGFKVTLWSTLLLAPALLCMALGWISGWENSFSKGYEKAFIGPGVSLIGVALFIVIMFYLPMAQVRCAVTGRIASLFDFRANRKVIKSKWYGWFFLSLAYVGFSVLAWFSSSLLGTITASDFMPWVEDLDRGEAVLFLYVYWGAITLGLFPLFCLLRAWAAWLYAGTVWDLTGKGWWTTQDLSGQETEWLGARCKAAKTVKRTLPKRFVLFATRALFSAVLVLVWFVIPAQTYFAQFFAYQPPLVRWGNHPMVQLPWIKYIPGHLRKPNNNDFP